MSALDPAVAALQKLQLDLNGRVVLSLMNRVQARGSLIVKGKPVQLFFPSVVVHIEAMFEEPRGGYVVDKPHTVDELKSITVLKREELPTFESVRAYALSQLMSNLDIGKEGDGRLQLAPLDMCIASQLERADMEGNPVVAACSVPNGSINLLAQGELHSPINLDKLKGSFFIESVTVSGQREKIGPFTDKDIMKQFNEDCALRKSFFRANSKMNSIEKGLLVMPMQVGLTSPDGQRVLFTLVRHAEKVCVLGVSFAINVLVSDVPPSVECAICLEDCNTNEWSCVQCHNLMHHKCYKEIVDSGIAACPYCRLEF